MQECLRMPSGYVPVAALLPFITMSLRCSRHTAQFPYLTSYLSLKNPKTNRLKGSHLGQRKDNRQPLLKKRRFDFSNES